KAGGIRLCSTDADVRQAAKELLGKTLVTAQTGPEGLPVHRLLVEQALPLERELYVGLVLDRKRERIVVVAHPHGGMEIEEIAKREPGAILRGEVEAAVGSGRRSGARKWSPPWACRGSRRGSSRSGWVSRRPRSIRP